MMATKRKDSKETLEKVLSDLASELTRSLDELKCIIYADNVALNDVIRQINDIVEKYRLLDEVRK